MKKSICLLLAALLVATVAGGMTACKKKNDENTLYIEIDNAGYGVAWADPLIEMFEKEHPGVKVKKTFMTKNPSAIVNKIFSGSSNLDLIFVETNLVYKNVEKTVTTPDGTIYDSPFFDLTQLYEKTIPNENVNMREKMNEAWYNYNISTVKGEKKIYSMPWIQSMFSIVMSNKVFREAGLEKIPNTTDEMFAMAEGLHMKYAQPFIHSIEKLTYDYCMELWMSQYNGTEKMNKFWQGYAVDTAGTPRYVPEIYINTGLQKAIECLGKLINYDNGYIRQKYVTLDHTSVQNKFLEGQDDILFMPAGLWLEREMSANYEPDECDIQMIKTPVISALGDKLGITDAVMSEIIDYADGTIAKEAISSFESSKGFSADEVIDAVVDARQMVAANHTFSAAIPSYSTKKDLAQDFLQLMASDRGIEAMLDSGGFKAPFKYDLENSSVKESMSRFTYSAYKIAEEGKFNFGKTDNLFMKTGLSIINHTYTGITLEMGAINAKDRLTPSQVYMANYNKVKNSWQTYLDTAGISY